MKAQAQSLPESGKQLLAGCALIGLAVLLCYLPVFGAGFIWDDNSMVTENRLVQAPDGLRAIWFSTEPVDYWPLTYSSFWLEWRLWGLNAAGYHITNILLHAVSSMLLWRVLRRILPRAGMGAWVAAMIFAVHPVNVESVAWIAERKNTLSMVFCLLAVLWYLQADSESRSTPFGKWYWLALGAFALSLLAKTSPVMLPFVLLLHHWWRRSSLVLQPIPNRNTRRAGAGKGEIKIAIKSKIMTEAKAVKPLVPFFLIAFALGLATVWFQTHRAIAGEAVRGDSFLSRLAGAGWAAWFYLYKALVPVNLSFVYPRWVINPHSIPAWLPLLALIAGFGWLGKSRQAWGRAALFGLGSFVLLLLPVLGFINIYFFRYSLVADHWQYFALPCVIALAVANIAAAWHRGWLKARSVQWAGAAIVVTLAALAWNQAHLYENNKIIWLDTLKKNPNSWLALDHVGTTLFEAGQVREAEVLWQRALVANPDFATTHNNLGLAAHSQGRTEEAVGRWRDALAIQPDNPEALNNLGNTLFKSGQKEEGLALLRRVLKINPRHDGAYNNLGFASFSDGQLDTAIELFQQALRFNPNNADARYNLGVAHFTAGRVDEAISQWQHALTLNPKRAETLNNLGYAFFSKGRLAEAITHLEKALALNPNHATARNTLAKALVQAGRPAEAIALWRHAIELNPQSVPERNGLAWVLATSPDAAIRNGEKAVALAAQTSELAAGKNPQLLGTLAAAYAEAGKFSDAVATARRAVHLAAEENNPTLADKLRRELSVYESGSPYREQGRN